MTDVSLRDEAIHRALLVVDGYLASKPDCRCDGTLVCESCKVLVGDMADVIIAVTRHHQIRYTRLSGMTDTTKEQG